MKEETSKKVIQTYVYSPRGDFFVSTCYRRSSAALNPDGWYYEIYGWKLDENGKRGEWILEDAATYPEQAFGKHNEYCKELYERGEIIKKED